MGVGCFAFYVELPVANVRCSYNELKYNWGCVVFGQRGNGAGGVHLWSWISVGNVRKGL